MSTNDTVQIRPRNERESGVAIIVVMMFALVFLALGAALFVLIRTSQSSTELERKEVKAFNVAEAGVDAGMLALKLHWPNTAGAPLDATVLDPLDALVQTQLRTTNPGLRLPRRSNSKFVEIQVYDNVDAGGNPTTIPYPSAPKWDSKGDGLMFVDSRANVEDDRHRIVILAQRSQWDLALPDGLGIMANSIVGSGGQGIRLSLDNPLVDGPAYAKYDPAPPSSGSGVNLPITLTGTQLWPPGPSPSDPTDAAHMSMYKTIANNEGTYFHPGHADDAKAFLLRPDVANNKIVYVEFGPSDTMIDLSGNSVFPSITGDAEPYPLARNEPLFLVLDTRNAAADLTYALKISGGSKFIGVIASNGSIWVPGGAWLVGAMWTSKTIDARGTGIGNSDEVLYSRSILASIQESRTVSVNIVPNTWEEVAVP